MSTWYNSPLWQVFFVVVVMELTGRLLHWL